MLADPPEPDDAEGFATERLGRVARPGLLPDQLILHHQVFDEHEHQAESMLGDRFVVARRNGDEDAALGGRRDVDRIVADSDPADDLELRVGIEHARRVRLRAG